MDQRPTVSVKKPEGIQPRQVCTERNYTPAIIPRPQVFAAIVLTSPCFYTLKSTYGLTNRLKIQYFFTVRINTARRRV
ncbi:MAG: hypothetical protein QNI88_08825 [Desulfobacterales bacterium]|nr:hypothetical protein [Desulfobacterales bacterium]